jgi:hypothetical protein
MKVFPTTVDGRPDGAYLPVFRELARIDRFGVHRLTDEHSQADCILFLDANEHASDWALRTIRRHPLTKAYRKKVFIYNELDQPWCAVQGLYASMPRSCFDTRRQRACAYLLQDFNPYIPWARESSGEPDLLYSFLGRRCPSHSLRERVLGLPQSRSVLVDTSDINFFGSDAAGLEGRKREYAQVMCRSKFVLCPRGAGTSSFRLFEAMAAGRVPVVISDEWVPPPGPDWSGCALFVPEADVADVPRFLAANEHRAAPMGIAARREWEAWFAPDVLFHHMIEACASIMNGRRIPESIAACLPSRRYLRLRMRHTKGWLVDMLASPGSFAQSRSGPI